MYILYIYIYVCITRLFLFDIYNHFYPLTLRSFEQNLFLDHLADKKILAPIEAASL